MVRDFEGLGANLFSCSRWKLKQKLTTGKNWRTEIEEWMKKNKLFIILQGLELSTRANLYSVAMNGKNRD